MDPRGVRHLTEFRPLRFKSAENNVVVGIASWCLKPVTADGAEVSQRGFVGKRQLAQNAVDLDSLSRKAATSMVFQIKNDRFFS